MSLQRLVDKNVQITGITGTTYSDAIDVSDAVSFSVQAVADVNTPAAKTFDSNTYEVAELTFETKANTTHQDYVVITSASGLTFAVALTKPVNEVQTLTFPAVAAATAGDYVVLTDGSGLTWAISLDKTGADPEPTGAAWVAVNAARKVHVDISGGTDAASVAALVETAFDALTGVGAAIVTDDSAANGTMLLTMQVKAPCTNPVPHNADDSGAGSITGVQTTGGVASSAPSGAAYTAVNAARKGLADISGDTTAAQVAARVETALNALTGFTALITTNDTAADGTMLLTQTAFGNPANPVPHNEDDSGDGTIVVAETTGGHDTELELTDNEITIPSHGFFEGLKGQLTTTGVLPTGLSAATDYFVIVVDSNTIKLATSLANAQAGTAIDITGEGNGVHTFTPTTLAGATIKLQKTNAPASLHSGSVWTDIATAENITDDETNWYEYPNATVTAITFKYFRIAYTLTAGSITSDNYVLVKG